MANYVKSQGRHVDVMNVASGLKLYDLICLSFCFQEQTSV